MSIVGSSDLTPGAQVEGEPGDFRVHEAVSVTPHETLEGAAGAAYLCIIVYTPSHCVPGGCFSYSSQNSMYAWGGP
jgi:hypothetical protein